MPASNFQQWNPPAANQESDAGYTADAMRSGGALTNGIPPSNMFNKFAYQVTTWITAFCNMLVAKGFSPNDGSASPGTALSNLQGILANVITTPDLVPYATLNSPTFTGVPQAPTPTAGDNSTKISTTAFVRALFGGGFVFNAGTNGYIKLPTILGGFIIQWVQCPSNPPTGETFFTQNFPIPFPIQCLMIQLSVYAPGIASSGEADSSYQLSSFSTVSATIKLQEFSNGRSAATSCFMLAVGY